MNLHLSSALLIAVALLGSCKGAQVGVITKPTSATTNLEGHEYPKINPDLSATFRNDFPDAKSVTITPATNVKSTFLKNNLFIRYTSHYEFLPTFTGLQSSCCQKVSMCL